MQESAPVGFDPMYEGQLPWSIRLFVMYLIVVLLVSCFRAVRLVWDLRSPRKATAEVLMTFCLGLFVCAALYAFAFLYETLLLRYKLRQLSRGNDNGVVSR